MKKYYFLLLAICAANFIQAQIVNIPDANFKNALLNHSPVIDTSGDGEIQEGEAVVVTFLYVNYKSISSLEGIQYFTGLTVLYCNNNQLTSLDLSTNIALTELNCINNQLTNLDLSTNTGLTVLNCSGNQLASLDVSTNIVLTDLRCYNNQLASLDLSTNIALTDLHCYGNQLASLDVSTNIALIDLRCSGNQLASLDLSTNTVLTNLRCFNNQLTSLDLGTNTGLSELYCYSNQLTNLDISTYVALTLLDCRYNQLMSLDLSENIALEDLHCNNNQLVSLDLSANIALTDLDCGSNQLTNLDLKNGSLISSYFSFSNNINLTFVCADEEDLQLLQSKIDAYGYTNCTVNSYCSFTPGGIFYEVSGEVKLDVNTNGCDAGDSGYNFLQYNINDGTTSGAYIGNATGQYTIPINAGNYTITPQLENPSYFIVSPASITVDFPTDISPYNQDFCVTLSGVHNDVEINILPINQASPGFDANYKLFYKNKGTTALSGSVDFNFNDNVLDFVSAIPIEDVQNTGALTWNYTNLQPFETRTIDFTMNINTPTDPTFPVVGDDVLNFAATINPVSGDETPADNVFELSQTVVNAYDPNNKTCLEGKTIEPSEVGEYVHYMIRFENTGSSNAINIVVKDVIDVSMYDVSTLKPLHGSHDYYTRIKNINEVEFIFENINLPFDNANNDGFLAFKIKTLPTLVENDTFENEAEIYFDYNFPIITDKEVTTVINPLGVSEYILDPSLKMYPNPTKDFIKISGNNNLEKITLYDINGRLLQEVKITGNQIEKEISLQQLTSGIYLIKVHSDKGMLLEKLVKE